MKNGPAVQETQETWTRSLGWGGSLEEGVATHSGILAWGIPWTEEPGALQSMGSPESWTQLKRLSMHPWALGEKAFEDSLIANTNFEITHGIPPRSFST